MHGESLCLKNPKHGWRQCCESMTFLCGSGSVDPCLWLMDPDPDPAIFIFDPQEANKKLIYLKTVFLHINFWGTKLHHFSKIKFKKIRIQEAQKHVDPDPDRIRIHNTGWRIHGLLLPLPEEELAAWPEVREYTGCHLRDVANSQLYFSAKSPKTSMAVTKFEKCVHFVWTMFCYVPK